MEHSQKMSAMGVSVVMLVVGALAGFGITKAADNGSRNNLKKQVAMAQAPNASTKAADLRASLVQLGVEHMTYTDQAIDAALDGSPNAKQLAAALYQNGNSIGNAVGSVYGKSAETTFDSVWKLHLDQFVNYAVAGSKGDSAGQQTALQSIDSQYTKPLAKYLANANPNINESDLETALRHHVSATAEVIDKHIQKDYAGEADALEHANGHMEEIFSSLAGAIVKQYPTKF